MGTPLPTEVVRAAMLLRCNALCRGNSGIRLSTIETLLSMLNAGVHPIVPEKGSLGASGDLAPLSHMVLVMLGEGRAEYKGEIMSGREAMAAAGIPTVELAAKEGLALINGTQIMTAVGCLAVYDAVQLTKTADIACAMTAEALFGIKKAYDPKVHAVRGHKGQINSAKNLLTLLEGSKLAFDTIPGKVQDAYALRCTPQVHGASRDAIEYVYNAVSREINAVTDNPIIFPDDDEAISGGNFHGQPMALAFDFLGIALAEYANISERRIERLVNPQLSAGLPAFLSENGGLNSEDHVSMGTIAARKARMILDNAQKVIGIELFAASQALYLRGDDKLAPATKAVYNKIRESVAPIHDDIVMYEQMNKFDAMVKAEEIVRAAESVCGTLE